MDFKTFYTKLPVAERDAFAQRAGTTRGLCNQVAYAGKEIELGLADVFVKLADGALRLDELPLTSRAVQQRLVRDGTAESAPLSEPKAAA